MPSHYIEDVPINVLASVRKTVERARKRRMNAHQITFKDLHELQNQRIKRGTGPAVSSLPNLQSALSSFLSERQLTPESAIGSILRASYYKHLQAHAQALRNAGRTSAYISNRKSLLAQWRKCVIDYDRHCALELGQAHPFQQAVQDIIAKVPSRKALARNSGIPLATLKRWERGALPNASSVNHVVKLERLLGVATASLQDLLPPHIRQQLEGRVQPTQQIPFRTRLSASAKSPYYLKDANEDFRQQWADYVQYKVSELSTSDAGDDDDFEEDASLKRSKNGRWNATPAAVAVQSEANWYCFHKGRYVATANVRWGEVASFIGWLMLEEQAGGKGMPAVEAQTLSNLARRTLVKAFIEWKIARAGGIAHSGIFSFLQFVRSLCNARTGYLTQSAHRFVKDFEREHEAQWRKRCAAAFDSARKLAEELSNQHSLSRDPFEPIEQVLALSNPLDAVADMVARLSIAKPYTGGIRDAVWNRDRLLIKLLASNPVRDKNMRMLTYRPDNKGHLRKGEDGSWHIFIPRRELKNLKGAAKDRDYQMPVRREVWSDIEEYLSQHRTLLLKVATDLVFVSDEGKPFSQQGLAKRFRYLTKTYLSGCPGVGPHAMRHIVATSILKASPNDWAAAAWALHDREATVRAHYAHLAQHDAAMWLNKSFDGPFGRMH